MKRRGPRTEPCEVMKWNLDEVEVDHIFSLDIDNKITR